MTARRSKGDGGLHWDAARRRWIATASLGYDPAGKRVVKRGSGRTKTEAKTKLREVLRDYEDGLAVAPTGFTVKDAVTEWLTYGLSGRDVHTLSKYRSLSENHVIPALGARKLRDLSAEDVDRWLAAKSAELSTRSLYEMRSCLNRSIRRAMARDKVKRNVVELCSVPQGKPGRPSKSLTMAQAESILVAAEDKRMGTYILVSLLTGARTEELRALSWDYVDLVGDPEATPPVPPYMAVWRSVRRNRDTKTKKSRRTLALPMRCVAALKHQKAAQERERYEAGAAWKESGLVFTSSVGTPLDASHVRRDFRNAIRDAEGVSAAEWTPRELRHSFVSLLSDSGMKIEEISQLVGHSSTSVTELVYRHQIRPVIQSGATAMDALFPLDADPIA